jgi:hypothetical protein
MNPVNLEAFSFPQLMEYTYAMAAQACVNGRQLGMFTRILHRMWETDLRSAIRQIRVLAPRTRLRRWLKQVQPIVRKDDIWARLLTQRAK